ncbi:MAG: hypothetical protein KDN20_17980 [Verrucomicrobiae bacterium]|nr:hypothetical protein [Verrucomicrobiae bacterium]
MLDEIARILSLSPALVDWYWQYGSSRTGTWSLGMGSWLDQLHRLKNRAAVISDIEAKGDKPCLAIWGPSQTGKSTLLADYIDSGGDEFGNGTALQWSDSDPVLFVGDIRDGEVTVLNPFNKGADASGCVTRFVMRDSVPDPQFPVKVTFATEAQIMHALAVGYLSETKAKTKDDQKLSLDAEEIEKIVGNLKSTGPINREAFELLIETCDTIELLIKSNLDRYSNLHRDWSRSLRRSILESEALLCSVENVREFAHQVFWDSWPSLTKAFEDLRRKRAEISSLFGEKPLVSSYKLAALLLNISAAELYAKSEIVRNLVDSSKYSVSAEKVILGSGTGDRLFQGSQDFSLFQGLVWQLEVPLRSSAIQRSSPVVHQLLEKADLLDFPGVANEFKSSDPFSDSDLTTDPGIIYTKVLKRGKTASIVVTSANNLDIDGFSLLMRMNRYPSNPIQLQTGIRCWFESFGKVWPPKEGQGLPLNLVLTFTAALVNEVHASGIGYGLDPVFEKMQGLGYLSDPKVVQTFATNYPQFPDGKFQVEGAALNSVVEAIMKDKSFQRQFPETGESLAEMANNGGKDYFFRHLLNQANESTRPELVAERKEKIISAFKDLLARAMPGQEDATLQRIADIDTCIECIQRYLNESKSFDPSRELGQIVQEVINVAPETLEPIPRNAGRNQRNKPLRPYLEKQFNDWREDKLSKPNLNVVAGSDETLLSRLLVYFSESADLDELLEFTLKYLGNIRTRVESQESRRFLATKMNNLMLGVGSENGSGSHPPLADAEKTIKRIAKDELSGHQDLENSPYYVSVITPFMKRLEYLKSSQGSERGEQPGDQELIRLTQVDIQK